MTLPELLAPAGDYDILVTAINAGADAVYISGERFGARALSKSICQKLHSGRDRKKCGIRSLERRKNTCNRKHLDKQL